jgi:hypothetical protein
MPSTPWSVIYNKLPAETRARIEASNKLLTEALQRYRAEQELKAESAQESDDVRRRSRARPRTGAKRKRVECFGHGVLNAGPRYRTAWQDVWLRWKGADRKAYRASPCLQSYEEAMFNLLSAEAELQCETDAQKRVRLEEDVAARRATIACLDAREYHATDGPCSDVSTWTRFVDRPEAERMLAYLLEANYGVRNPKFVWRRGKRMRKHGPVTAHSFMPGDDTAS